MRPLLVLVGRSGTGKSTLAAGLVSTGLVDPLRTWTTRPPRADEDPGSSDHVFVDAGTFAAASDSGELVVTVELFGHRYGLPRLPVAPASAPERPLLLVGRGPLLPLLGPLHRSPLVYALTADGHDLSTRVAERSLPAAERRARDAFARAEVTDGAHRVFHSSALTPDELLGVVIESLRADLAPQGDRANTLVEAARD